MKHHPPAKPIPELGGRTFAELEASRHDSGALMVREQLREIDADGTMTAVDIRVKLPVPLDYVKAALRAREWAASIQFDPGTDASLFESMKQVALLSLLVRTVEAPHAQFADVDELGGGRYQETSLLDLLERINVYKDLFDPRHVELDEEKAWETTFAVVRAGHLGPLTDIAGSARPSFLLFMARQAATSPTAQSFAQSRGISTPASSSSATSPSSSEGATH